MSNCPNCNKINNRWRSATYDYGKGSYVHEKPWYTDVCFVCGWCEKHRNYDAVGGGTGANHAGGAVNNVRIGQRDEVTHPYDMYTGDRSFKDLGVCSLTDENGNKIIASNYAGIKAGFDGDDFNRMYHYWQSGYFNWANGGNYARAESYFRRNEIVRSNFTAGKFAGRIEGKVWSPFYFLERPYINQYRSGSIALTGMNFVCWNRLYTFLSGGNIVRLMTGNSIYNPRYYPIRPDNWGAGHGPFSSTYWSEIDDMDESLQAPIVFHGDVKVRFENYKRYHCAVDPNENMVAEDSLVHVGDFPNQTQSPVADYNNDNYYLESQTLQTSIYSFTDHADWPTHQERYVLGKNSTNGELVQVGSGASNSPFRLGDLLGTFPKLSVDCYWSGGQWNGTVSIDYNTSAYTAIKDTKIYDFYSLEEVNQRFPFIQNGGQLLKYRFDGAAKISSGGVFGGSQSFVSAESKWPFEHSGWTGIMDKMGPDNSGFRTVDSGHIYGMSNEPGGLGSYGGYNWNFSYDPTGGEDWLGQGDCMNHPSSGLVFNIETGDNVTGIGVGDVTYLGGPLSSKLFYTSGQSIEIAYYHYTGTGVTESGIINNWPGFDRFGNFVKTGKYITPKWIFFKWMHYINGGEYLHYAQQDLDSALRGFMWSYDDSPTGNNWKCVDYYGQEINSPLQPNFEFIHTDDLPAVMNFTGYIFTNSGAYDALNKWVQLRTGSNYELADATDVLGSDATINIQALIDPYTVRATAEADVFGRPVPSFISSNIGQLFTLDPRSHQTYDNGNWYYTGDGKDQVSGKIICLNPDKITAQGMTFVGGDASLSNVTTNQIITGNTAHYDTKFLHDDWLIVKEPCFDYWLSGHSGVTSGYQPLSSYFNRDVVGYGALRTPDSALSAGGSYPPGLDPRRHHNTGRWDYTIFALKKPLSQIDGPSQCSKVKDFYSGLGLEFSGNHIEKLRKLISGVSDRSDPFRYYDNPSGFYYEVQNGQAGGLLSKSDYESGKCCSGQTVSTHSGCSIFDDVSGDYYTWFPGDYEGTPAYFLRSLPPATNRLCVSRQSDMLGLSSLQITGNGGYQWTGDGGGYNWTLSGDTSGGQDIWRLKREVHGYVVDSYWRVRGAPTGVYNGPYGYSPAWIINAGFCS